MFNLEQAIADWRQKMQAAGIESPIPLEELESHLREEMERQVRAGMKAEEAFDKAVQCIGAARPLHKEFRKNGSLARSSSQIYNRALAAFALYVILGTIETIHEQGSGGPITECWVGVENILTLSFGYYQDPPGWTVLWLNLFNFIFAAAMIAVLVARRYLPKYGPRPSQMLNWALFLAWPWGPLIGLYGLGSSEAEKTDGAHKSWLVKFFAFSRTPLSDQSISFSRRLLAASLQVLRASVLFLFGCWGVVEVYMRIMIMKLFLGVVTYNLTTAGRWPISAISTTIGAATVLIFIGASFMVNAWLVWFVWQIFRGERSQPKIAAAYV